MRVLPICPLQEGYSVEPDDGISAVRLAGGGSRVEIISEGNAGVVNVSWNLTAAQYDLMTGFHRVWKRTTEPFLAGLIIDSSSLELHEAAFVPNTFRLTGKSGRMYFVVAQLEVIPLDIYLDPETDPGEALVMLNALYGTQAGIVLNQLEKLVNEDLPHA